MPSLSITSPKTSTLPAPKTSAGRPVEGAPVHAQPQIALALRREAADRRSVEGQVVPALDQELLVVIQHVQAAFQVAEQDGDRLDALLVRQVLEALLLDLVRGRPLLALLLGLQVQLFQFVIGKSQKIAQFVRHDSPLEMGEA